VVSAAAVAQADEVLHAGILEAADEHVVPILRPS